MAAEMVATEAEAVETTTTTTAGTTDEEDGRAALPAALPVDHQVDPAAKAGAKEKDNNSRPRDGFHLRLGRRAPACASGTGSGNFSSGGR